MPQPPSFNEQDVSDKPRYIRKLPLLDQSKIDKKMKDWQDACATLRSIDDAVGTIIDHLRSTGRLNDTFILFASDNGLSYGEHRVLGKAVPYEESIRVPLIIRYDPLTHAVAGDTANEQVVNLDYASTLSDVAGVTPGLPQDGVSLMPLVADPTATLPRNGFVIEHHALKDDVPDFCGVRDHLLDVHAVRGRRGGALRPRPRQSALRPVPAAEPGLEPRVPRRTGRGARQGAHAVRPAAARVGLAPLSRG